MIFREKLLADPSHDRVRPISTPQPVSAKPERRSLGFRGINVVEFLSFNSGRYHLLDVDAAPAEKWAATKRYGKTPMSDQRPSHAIRYVKQAAGKLSVAAHRLEQALESLHGRKPEAAKQIDMLADSLAKQQGTMDEIIELLESDSAP